MKNEHTDSLKCFTKDCKNQVSSHEWNDFDLWCGSCHAKARGRDKETGEQKQARLLRAFQKRVAADGHKQRGNYS